MLKLKHIPVKSFGENIAYIYKDCAFYKVDDLNKVTKLEIHKGNKTIYAFLQIVAEEGVLAADEIGLNRSSCQLGGTVSQYASFTPKNFR